MKAARVVKSREEPQNCRSSKSLFATKRILHVLGGTHRGGIETWLVHVLRRIDRRRFAMDFFVHDDQKGAYDHEIEALGSRIIRCPYYRRPWKYARHFIACLKNHGPYDIVHTHGGYFSGLNMVLAALAGVPVRIVHSHNDLRWLRLREGTMRHAYYRIMSPLVLRWSSAGLAASRLAAEDYYGMDWEASQKFRVLSCGVDLKPFGQQYEPTVVRKDLGIPNDAFVIGHVGRFTDPKNHPFMFEIVREVLNRAPKTLLMLAGDGCLEPQAKAQVREMKLEDKVLFLGSRGDVPRLLLGCIDVFLFPSLCEGLGLALIEAQAAGLPCVISDVIPPEADVVIPLITRLSLSHSAEVWADALMAARSKSRQISQPEALAAIMDSPFNVERSVKSLQDFYETCCNSRGSREQ